MCVIGLPPPSPGRCERGGVPNLPNVSEHQHRYAAGFMTSKAGMIGGRRPPSLRQREPDGDQGRPNEQARCASSSNRHSAAARKTSEGSIVDMNPRGSTE